MEAEKKLKKISAARKDEGKEALLDLFLELSIYILAQSLKETLGSFVHHE